MPEQNTQRWNQKTRDRTLPMRLLRKDVSPTIGGRKVELHLGVHGDLEHVPNDRPRRICLRLDAMPAFPLS